MRVISVNVGMPQPLPRDDGTVMSGILKRPVEGPVAVGRINLAGDAQADRRVHGGPDMAVYAYPVEHYARWAGELGRSDLGHGHFGENLTTEGLDEGEVWFGDRFRVGSALLEVSKPRVPCFKLAIRMGDPGFAAPFLASGRTGFYLRVLEEGRVAAGDPIVREGRGEGGMSVREVVGLMGDGADPADLDRVAALPGLALDWREKFAGRALARRRRAG